MRIRAGTIVVLCAFLAVGSAVAAEQSAKVTAVAGDVAVQAGGKGPAKGLKTGDALEQGDAVKLAPGAKLSIAFSDGATMDVAGPASFALRLLADFARTVELRSGSVNRLVVKKITTGVTTPLDAFVAVQGGVFSVKLDSVGGKDRATFKLWEGKTGKVIDGGRTRVLRTARPIVVERLRAAAPPRPGPRRPVVAGETAVLTIGGHKVEMTPKQYFRTQPTAGGGAIITSVAPEGEFGMVTIDEETSFYLSKDESIELDGAGTVVRHNGIVHVYAALDVRGIYDEAVADPSDSSPTGEKKP